MKRLVRVARIQLVNGSAVLGMPILVLAVVLLANLVLFGAMNASESGGDPVTGAVLSAYIVMLVVHLQTMTQMFPFAVSLSVTRRDFFGGTVLVVLGQSLLYGVLLTVLGVIEKATGGWGVNMTMIALPFLEHGNPVAQVLAYTVPFLSLSFLDVWAGIVFKRWGPYGMWALTLGLAALVVGFVALASWLKWWPAVFEFLTSHPPLALQAGYPFAVAVVLAVLGYLTARRTVP